METLTTCPRGHALTGDAVFCEICWIRVSSDDAATQKARSTSRRSLVALSLLFGASCLAVGVGAAALIASATDDVATPIAAAQPTVAASTIPVVAVDQPVAVAVAPLAATVPKTLDEPVAPGCVATVRGDQIACTLTDDRLEFTLCVPGATTFIRVGTRPDNTVKFHDAVSTVVLGGPSSCTADAITASVQIDSYSPAVMWRVVGRDGGDDKIWKSRVVADAPAP